MVGPGTAPQHGITNYFKDKTQGPVCAMSCPAATLYRNYFVGATGQSVGNQLDGAKDIGLILNNGKHK